MYMRKITNYLILTLIVALFSVWIYWFSVLNKTTTVNADVSWAWPVLESNLFNNFYTWRKWKVKDFDSILLLLKSNVKKEVNASNDVLTKYNNSYVDVNNDNYTDLVITDFNKVWVTKKWDTKQYYEYQYFYWLLLGNWELSFQAKYRCVYVYNEIDSTKTWYYWDCVK